MWAKDLNLYRWCISGQQIGFFLISSTSDLDNYFLTIKSFLWQDPTKARWMDGLIGGLMDGCIDGWMDLLVGI